MHITENPRGIRNRQSIHSLNYIFSFQRAFSKSQQQYSSNLVLHDQKLIYRSNLIKSLLLKITIYLKLVGAVSSTFLIYLVVYLPI